MSVLYKFARGSWRVCWNSLPPVVRDRTLGNPAISTAKRYVVDWMTRGVDHNTIYDDVYFQSVDETALASASVIAGSVVESYHPARVLDVGCGTGALMECIRDRGVEVAGLEYSEAAIAACRQRNLNVQKFNLEQEALAEKRTADVCVSLEVAEHLPASCADRYVDLLCSVSDRVVFSAATPGQGGTDHVNEQPNEYWIEKFAQRGFQYEEQATQAWRASWKDKRVVWWYYANLMLFTRQTAVGDDPSL